MLFKFVSGKENKQAADGIDIDPGKEIPALHIPFLHATVEKVKDEFIHPAKESRNYYE